MTLHVSCAVAGDYVPHSAAMLHSVLTNRDGEDVVIHFLHGRDLGRRPAHRLDEMVAAAGGSIVFHEIAPERVAGLPVRDYFTAAMWYRIFLPELVDSDRALYLDVDTIVAAPLTELFATDLGNAYLAAVDNIPLPWLGDRAADLGLARYFNSGVLLLNIEAMRADGRTRALVDVGRGEAARLLWPDQDALNLALGERRVSLSPRWNAMNALFAYPEGAETFSEELVEQVLRSPGIRHYEGPGANKPWHHDFEHPHRELYLRHREATPWPRTRIEGLPRRRVVARLRQALMAMRPL